MKLSNIDLLKDNVLGQISAGAQGFIVFAANGKPVPEGMLEHNPNVRMLLKKGVLDFEIAPPPGGGGDGGGVIGIDPVPK